MTFKFIFQIAALIILPGLFAIAHAQSTNSLVAASDTNSPTVLPEITVIGQLPPESFTSPSDESANRQKTQIPGGFNDQDDG